MTSSGWYAYDFFGTCLADAAAMVSTVLGLGFAASVGAAHEQWSCVQMFSL